MTPLYITLFCVVVLAIVVVGYVLHDIDRINEMNDEQF